MRRAMHLSSAIVVGGLAANSLLAQEAMYTQAATMPSPGIMIVRQQLHYYQFGHVPGTDIDRTQLIEWQTGIQYGLARDWSVSLDIPVAFREENTFSERTDLDKGVEDLDLMFKWRFYKSDDGGINTVRAALLFGAEFASGDDADFSSQTVNPHIGGVLTVVRGRHGFNQELKFIVNTGSDDDHNTGGDGSAEAIFYNSAYVYRIFPERFTSESNGAWYVTAELNGIYEFNGDHEIRVAPGVMYEGRRWAFEAMMQLPLWRDLDERAELDLGFGVGFRLTF